MRAVIDYHVPNEAMLDSNYPLPIFHEVLRDVVGCYFFNALDVKSAFHLIPLAEELQVWTTFPLRDKLLRWTRLVEGLKPAPGICQATFTRVLDISHKRGTTLWIDDLLTYHVTWQESLDALEDILKKAVAKGVVFSLPKCVFLQREVKWWGRRIGYGQVHPPANYLAKVLERPRPSTVGQMRSWTAAVNWVVEYLPEAQRLMVPLHDLTSKGAVGRTKGKSRCVPKATLLSWTPEALRAYDLVRSVCANPATLQIPDVNQPFGIRCDGSKLGWAAMLLQRQTGLSGGPWRPVGFAGGRWAAQREITACSRTMELGALRRALRHWSYLVRNGRSIRVWTDHRSLSQKVEPHTHDPDWVRQIVADVLSYPLLITYIKGSDMGFPDFGSRSGVPGDDLAED